MSDSTPTPRVLPEAVGESRPEARARAAADASGRTLLGWGATAVAVFGVVVLLFLIFLVVILTSMR